MSNEIVNGFADAFLAIAGTSPHLKSLEEELFACAQAIGGSEELKQQLSNTELPVAVRTQIIEDLLANKVSATAKALVSLVVTSGHVGYLPEIVDGFVTRSTGSRGELLAEVRSAVRLTDDQKQRLADALSAKHKAAISLRNVVDPTVVGGVVTQVGDTLLDGSLRTRLTQLRESF